MAKVEEESVTSTDSLRVSRLTALGWGGGTCWGVEGLGKKEKGLIDTDNSVVLADGGVEVEEGVRGINGSGEKCNNKIN